MLNDLMKPQELSEILEVKPITLEVWRSHGKGPAWVKLGRKVFYDRHVVEEWIRQQTRDPRKLKATKAA